MRLSNIFLVIIFMISCFGPVRLAKDDTRCYTPDDDPGRCISIRECYPLYVLIKKSPLPTSDLILLRKSYCGFTAGLIPKVCCPIPFEDITSQLLPDKSICGKHTSYRIYGGERAGLKEFPWTALLEYENSYHQRDFLCGGVLISQRYILTASHCAKDGKSGKKWKLVSVRLGEYNISSDQDCVYNGFWRECNNRAIDIEVEKIISHENYDMNNKNRSNDIALLRLSRNVIFTDTIKPICLPLKRDERRKTYVGDRLTVAGWGKSENEEMSDFKLKLQVPVKSRDGCNSLYNAFDVSVSESQLCAGGEKGKDSCRGDSGGPLMALSTDERGIDNWYLAGIVSFGPNECGLRGWPAVYTRVSKYIPWIVSKLESSNISERVNNH